MLNRHVLLKLEKEFEKTLDWDRREVKRSAAHISAQFAFPPEDYVIQGLMPAPKSNAPKNHGCKGCEFYHPVKKCIIKASKGIVMKRYCPKKFMKPTTLSTAAPARSRPIIETTRIVYDEETKSFKSIRSVFIPFRNLCESCDFYNKIDKYCALIAIGRPCILASKFNIKVNGEKKAVQAAMRGRV